MKLILVLSLFLTICASAGTRAQTITISLDSVELKKAMEETQAQTSIRFLYNESIIPSGKKISLSVKNMPIAEFLSRFFKGTGIGFKIMDNNLVVLTSEVNANAQAAEKRITGRVTDESGQPVVGATIAVKGAAGGTVTDAGGNFSINVPDDAILVVTAVGYEALETAVSARSEFNLVFAAGHQIPGTNRSDRLWRIPEKRSYGCICKYSRQ